MARITLIVSLITAVVALLGGMHWIVRAWRQWRTKRLGTWVGLLALGLLMPSSLWAAPYYIDITLGDDTRTSGQAQSKTTPWKHLPCMVTATSNAAAYTPVAGDTFILKGGETWPNANFPCTVGQSGSAGNVITIGGTDHTWFTGGSWSQPIWDAGGSAIAGTYNHFLDLRGRAYVTFDDVEMIRFNRATGGYSFCQQIDTYTATNITLDHLHIHNWSGTSSDTCPVILGDTSAPFVSGSVLQTSHIHDEDGGETSDIGPKTGRGSVTYCFPSAKNNVIHNVESMLLPCGHGEISGNTFYNCYFPVGATGVHGAAIETLASDGTFYIYDNVIHDTELDSGGGNECESLMVGNPGETDYIWNNVIYDVAGNMPALTQNASPGVAVYFWNNTIVSGDSRYCIRNSHGGTYSVVEVQNNYCISSAAAVVDPTIAATTLTISSNLLQTAAAATAQGYTSSQSPYVYYPTSGGSTINAGANLSANCTGSNAGLCSDTTYGSLLTGNAVSGPGRTAVARGTTWDIGAYELNDTTPSPPTNLVVVRCLRWFELAATVTGIGWHGRRLVPGLMRLSRVLGARSYVLTKIVGQRTALLVLTTAVTVLRRS